MLGVVFRFPAIDFLDPGIEKVAVLALKIAKIVQEFVFFCVLSAVASVYSNFETVACEVLSRHDGVTIRSRNALTFTGV